LPSVPHHCPAFSFNIVPVPACVKLGNGQQASPVSEVVLASEINSQSKPVDASNVFTMMAEVIYLSLKLTDAPNNTAVMANSTLYSNTQNAQGTRYLLIYLSCRR